MKSKQRRILREQLTTTLQPYRAIGSAQIPAKGWIRTIREALGMSGSQLSRRMGVSQPRVAKLERDELSGALSIKTMRHVAESLDAVFVYGIVPRYSLEETLAAQARKVAGKKIRATSHTMLLEAQQLTDAEQQKMLEALIEELINEKSKELWNEQ